MKKQIKRSGIEVNVERITGSIAQGYISAGDLTEGQYQEFLNKLGYTSEVASFNCEIEFGIEWDHELPMAVIEAVVVFHNESMIDITKEIDESFLTAGIESLDKGSWAEDRIAAQGDYYYDMLRDR